MLIHILWETGFLHSSFDWFLLTNIGLSLDQTEITETERPYRVKIISGSIHWFIDTTHKDAIQVIESFLNSYTAN